MPHIVRVWDAPTRLFHWSLVSCVIGLFVTSRVGGEAMDWHIRFGYAVLTLLLFRLIWGFVGGHWSRFSKFLYSPAHVVRYLKGQGEASQSVGHNPAGSLSVWAILFLLALQVASGLLSDDEIAAAGPLSRHVSEPIVNQATTYHTTLGQYGLLLMLGLHLSAIAFYLVKKKENLAKAMITGDKLLSHAATQTRDRWTDRAKAMMLFALCWALVAGWLSWLS